MVQTAKFPSYGDIVFLVFISILGSFYLVYKWIIARDTLEFNYETPPNRGGSMVIKFLWKIITNTQGHLSACLDDKYILKITAHNCRIDVHNLQKYQKLCGYKIGQNIPICYPELLYTKLLTRMIVSTKFRLSPLGLIHINQEVEAYGSIKVKNPYTLSAEVAEYRQTERGVEVDIKLELYENQEECLWRSKMTLLSRKSGVKKTLKPQKEQVNNEEESYNSKVSVARNTGVKYAKVSGDWNPHHLYGWTAKLLGFKDPIAHGMWTLAVGVNHLETQALHPPGYPKFLQARFKRPLFMPSDVTVKMGHLPNHAAGSWLQVEDQQQIPHLVGKYCSSKEYLDGAN